MLGEVKVVTDHFHLLIQAFATAQMYVYFCWTHKEHKNFLKRHQMKILN